VAACGSGAAPASRNQPVADPRPTVSASKRGTVAPASAAPRASANSASSGRRTGSDVDAASRAVSASTPAPGPTTNTVCGGSDRVSRPPTMAITSPAASESARLRLDTRTTAPSSVCTTARVARSCSTNSSAVRRQPVLRPIATASALAACSSETRVTSAMSRGRRASRSRAAAAWSVHATPTPTSLWPLSMALSRVPRIAATTCSTEPVSDRWSTVTPSASAPSTSTMRTAAGVIDTPSTTSTPPPSMNLSVHRRRTGRRYLSG